MDPLSSKIDGDSHVKDIVGSSPASSVLPCLEETHFETSPLERKGSADAGSARSDHDHVEEFF